jgi:hypothetical protein
MRRSAIILGLAAAFIGANSAFGDMLTLDGVNPAGTVNLTSPTSVGTAAKTSTPGY